MTPHFSVVLVQMHSGERMPLMLDASTGLGVFEPTAYALTLRSRNLAANTIAQALRAVQLLYEILGANKVNLLRRIKANELLTLGEIEALVEQCKLKKHDLNELHYGPLDAKVARLDLARLKKGRIAKTNLAQVDNNTALIRLTYVKSYLGWLADYAYLQELPSSRKLFKEVADKTVKALGDRMPKGHKHNRTKGKRGLSHEQEARLLALVDPEAKDNPWTTPFVRERNNLIVRFLLGTGVRKGEMLGVKINDLQFSTGKVLIARRADDPEDPRGREPVTKTYDRTLLLGSDLIERLQGYLKSRRSVERATKHPYVFVAETGAPMSLSAVDYLFSTLRVRLPDIKQLSPHIGRHTWNDRFSEFAEAHQMNEDEEKKIRNYVMGWSDNGTTAALPRRSSKLLEKPKHG